MDWSKAKSILIVALLITNLILLGVIVSRDKVSDPTTTVEFKKSVENMLREDEIYIKTEIPSEKSNLKPLIVEYEDLNISELYRSIFGKEMDKNADLISFSDEIDGESIKIKKKKYFRYDNKKDEKNYDLSSEDDAISIAEDFIKNLGFDGEDVSMSYIRQGDGEYHIKYSKEFEGNYVEKAYMDLKVDEVGVRFFERVWLNVLDKGESVINISSAPKSLLSLLGREDLQGAEIIDISLSHYFDPEEHEYVEMPKDPRKGKTIPAWRIQFEDGRKIIIDNYR